MLVKVFSKNKFGKIEYTEGELTKLLNEIYEEGRKDKYFYYTTPYWNYTCTNASDSIIYTNTSTSDIYNTLQSNEVTTQPANYKLESDDKGIKITFGDK